MNDEKLVLLLVDVWKGCLISRKILRLKILTYDPRNIVPSDSHSRDVQLNFNLIFKVTAEQKIVYQSSFPRRVRTRKTDTCVYREDKYDSLQVGIPGSCKHGYSVVNDPEEVNIASELLDKQVTKVCSVN